MDLISEFYCSQCQRPLKKSGAMDENHAWCDECEAVVKTTQFRTKAWIIGVVVIIATNLLFRIWV